MAEPSSSRMPDVDPSSSDEVVIVERWGRDRLRGAGRGGGLIIDIPSSPDEAPVAEEDAAVPAGVSAAARW